MQDKGAEDRPEKAALRSGYWSRGLETEAGAMGLAGEARSRQREPREHRLEVKVETWKVQKELSVTSSPGGNCC